MSATSTELARREERAQGGIIQFAEEMQAIRDGKLYPNAGQTDAWKTYCKARWGQSESNVRGTIQALPVIKRLSASGASAGVPINAAREVAALPESVQDAILTETTYRDDVRAKAKAVRKIIKATEQNEGRKATVEEQVAAAANVTAEKPKKAKRKMKDSKFVSAVGSAHWYLEQAANLAHADPLSDVENDFGWNMVAKLKYETQRIEEKLYRPEIAKDADEEFAKLLGGEER